MSDSVEVGDWVQVYGQRVATSHAHEHPEEWVIRFESHNEDYTAVVRRDWVVKCPPPPPEVASPCTSLWAASEGGGPVFYRCIKHLDHAGDHELLHGSTWADEDTAGYFEEKT